MKETMGKIVSTVLCTYCITMTASAEPLPLPDRAIPLDCRLVNVVRNAGSASDPRDEFWSIIEFEGRMDLSEEVDFSAAQPFVFGGYEWIDATGVADIRYGDELIRVMNRVRVFKTNGTNDYLIGLPDFNELWVAVNGIGLGIQHEDRNAYNNSIMYEPPICHLIP